ncbi:MAG: amidohydrolase [Caldilineales bacterium]|nr:amidohydrolase [Caldilineales bacterium]MDW8317815.1 amidohydrolase [Anaerolineae bacterium]
MSDFPAFLSRARALQAQLTAWRRDLHQHPELAFEERRTAGIVAAHLAGLGLEVRTGVGRTGVVGVLEGVADGPTVMLRFDMDALPVHEETGLPFASKAPGRMHACGHDGHTAIGLGVATLLAERQQELAGRVKFVFQPAEEVGAGAQAMIADGALADPRPDVAFGLHLWSQLPVGKAVVRSGPQWASADRFDIEIVGRGTHGALPHTGVDAVVVAAYAIVQLQSVISRSLDPLQPAVVTIGTLHTGGAFNVVAERVQMSGTLRAFDEAVRAEVIRHMHTVLQGVTAAHGAGYTLRFSEHVPPLANHPEPTERLRRVAAAILGEDAVGEGTLILAAEDMAEFLKRVPGCYFVLGAQPAGLERGEPHHSPRFNIDEAALPLGAAILAAIAASYLSHEDGHKAQP